MTALYEALAVPPFGCIQTQHTYLVARVTQSPKNMCLTDTNGAARYMPEIYSRVYIDRETFQESQTIVVTKKKQGVVATCIVSLSKNLCVCVFAADLLIG